jgi:hypothetical protein
MTNTVDVVKLERHASECFDPPNQNELMIYVEELLTSLDIDVRDFRPEKPDGNSQRQATNFCRLSALAA